MAALIVVIAQYRQKVETILTEEQLHGMLDAWTLVRQLNLDGGADPQVQIEVMSLTTLDLDRSMIAIALARHGETLMRRQLVDLEMGAQSS